MTRHVKPLDAREIPPVRASDFYGTYRVTHLSFAEAWPGSLQQGDVLTISASSEPTDPDVSEGAYVMLRDGGTGETKMEGFLPLVNSCLGVQFEDDRLADLAVTTLQISRVVGGDAEAAGRRGYSVYGSVAVGDPQQVGVWGAEDDGGG